MIIRDWSNKAGLDDREFHPSKTIEKPSKTQVQPDFNQRTKTLSPKEISAMVSTKMKKTVKVSFGKKVTQESANMPIYFEDAQRQAWGGVSH